VFELIPSRSESFLEMHMKSLMPNAASKRRRGATPPVFKSIPQPTPVACDRPPRPEALKRLADDRLRHFASFR